MESKTILGRQWFADTGSGVWAVDASQRIVFWNQAAEELLGVHRRPGSGPVVLSTPDGTGHTRAAILPGRVPSHPCGFNCWAARISGEQMALW